MGWGRDRETKREAETDRETDRVKQTDRHRETETETETDRDGETLAETVTETETETEREAYIGMYKQSEFSCFYFPVSLRLHNSSLCQKSPKLLKYKKESNL